MIIGRAPLRITLAGGGTDAFDYFREFDGFTVSAAIDKYVYTSLSNTIFDYINLRYSEQEQVKNINDVKHNLIRESLKLTEVNDINIEITSFSDIKSGTGLGSSSSFCNALLKTLFKYKKKQIGQEELARMTAKIECDIIKSNTGWQDIFISSYGGINNMIFNRDDSVKIIPLNINETYLNDLENNILLFSTGIYRNEQKSLKEQQEKTLAKDKDMLNNLHFVKEIGYKMLDSLEKGDLVKYGELTKEHWENKKKRSKSISNNQINDWVDAAVNGGAIGAKLVGGGGAGYIFCYTEDHRKLRDTMSKLGLKELTFGFDYEGTKIL